MASKAAKGATVRASTAMPTSGQSTPYLASLLASVPERAASCRLPALAHPTFTAEVREIGKRW